MSTASPRSSPDPLNRASILPGWGDTIVLLVRILIGGIFVQSGFDKLMGLDAFAAGLARSTIAPPIAVTMSRLRMSDTSGRVGATAVPRQKLRRTLTLE